MAAALRGALSFCFPFSLPCRDEFLLELPAALARMTRLHTLGWLSPQWAAALLPTDDSAWLQSLHCLALPAEVAFEAAGQPDSELLLSQATNLEALCLTLFPGNWKKYRPQLLELATRLPALRRCSCLRYPHHRFRKFDLITGLDTPNPALRIDGAGEKLLAEMQQGYR